jgi:recombination protein RecT
MTQDTMNDQQKKQAQNLLDMLEKPQVLERFKNLATQYIDAEQMVHLAIECVKRKPALGECDHLTVLGAFITSQSVGLKPNTIFDHAYVIPYSKWLLDETRPRGQQWVKLPPECNFQVGYKGYSALFQRTGRIKDFFASDICENDHYICETGSNPHVEFRKNLRGRGEMIGSFCHVNFLNGGQAVEELDMAEIEKVRSTSETFKSLQKALEIATKKNDQPKIEEAQRKLAETPWIKWRATMSMKPAIKRLGGKSDIDPAVALASEADSLSDMGQMNFKAIADARSHNEVFDIINAETDRVNREAQAEQQQPLPVINLNEKPGKQPAPAAVKPNGKANPADAGPPAGHPASLTHDTGGF